MELKKILVMVLKTFLSLSLLIYMVHKIGWSNIITSLAQFQFVYLIPILFFHFLSYLVGCAAVQLLLKPLNKSLPFWTLFRYYMLSWAAGMFVPGKVGELSIIYFLKRRGISITEGLVVSLYDKLITAIVLGIFSLIGISYLLPLETAMKLATLGALGGLFFALISMWEKARIVIRRYILGRFAKNLTGFYTLFSSYSTQHWKALLGNVALTVLKLIFSNFTMYFVFGALGVWPPFWMMLLIIAAGTVISLLPISISGLGVREAAMVVLFLEVGVSASVTLSAFIIGVVVNYMIASIVFFVLSDEFVINPDYENKKN